MTTSAHTRRYSARRTARGDTVRVLGRAGFVARGVVYLLIAWITLMIALEHNTLEADRTGALELVAGKPFGTVVLWFIAIGFGGMALWRLSVAAYPPRGHNGTASRLGSLGRAVLYAVACVSTLIFLLHHHTVGSTDKTSRDFTTTAMRHSGGRFLVAVVGVGLIAGGLVLAWRGVTGRFAKNLRRSRMSSEQYRWVVRLGTIGNLARGVLIAAVGGFMLDAAVRFDPSKAKGVDSTLRAFAVTGYGPALLIAMAIGLAAFGAYSLCEARWRRL